MTAHFSLQGKTALVTGASSGIGLAIARRFKAAGAQVFGLDRKPTGEEGIPVLEVDVSDEAALAGAFEQVIARSGALHILINNAAIQPLGVSFAELTPELLRRTFEVNVTGVAMGLKLALQHMAPGGRIVNTGSFVGMLGVPLATGYGASKAAVIQLTRLAAVEFAPRGITVNCVVPGTIRTPFITGIPGNPEIPFMEARTPLGRLGEPEEVAAAFHFLASEEAAYVTGAVLNVDGGVMAGWERYDVVPPADVRDGVWCDPV